MSTWYLQFKDQVKEKLKKVSAEFYFIAVSGGRDSVFLFYLLKDILPKEKMVVLHMNYSLRGKFSDEDQVFVKKIAQQNGIVCRSTKINLEVKPGEGGLENTARIARYEWFKEKIASKNAVVFCGHTIDDHIETILMKLHRGSGLAGLKGIAFQQVVLGVNICRPLLYAERQQITQYLEDNKIQWRDDHTNESTVYFRNDIRMNLVPQLSISTKQRIIKLSILSRQLQDHFKNLSAQNVSGGLEFNFSEIEGLSLFERRYLIEKIFHFFGLPSGPDKKHMDRFQEFLVEKKAKIQLPNFINISYAREKLFFNKENIAPGTFSDVMVMQPASLAIQTKLEENELFALALPPEILPAIHWRWANLNDDLWRGKALSLIVKKLKVPPWRKIQIPLCEYQGQILFIGYLGVSNYYHNLISGQKELVTIEVLYKKVNL